MGACAERNLAQRIGLAGRGTGERDVRFDHGRARAVAELDDVARGDEAPFVAGAGEDQQQRLVEPGSLGNADDGAVRHERGVERDHGLLAGGAFARPGRLRRGLRTSAPPPATRSPAPRLRPRQKAQARTRRRRTPSRWRRARPALPAPHRSRPRTSRSSSPTAGGRASFRALRRSVHFHCSMRRCGRPSAAKVPMAALRASATARPPGSFAATASKLLGERLLHLGPCQRHGHVVSLASSTLEGLALELGVAGLLELQRQLLAAGLADLAAGHHVHLVGHDVVQAAAGSG